MTKIITPRKKGRRVQHLITDPSLTKSEFAKELNINSIMARVARGQPLPEKFAQAAAVFGDFSQIPDYATMHDKVMAGRELFNSLPAALRLEYKNDPAKFIAGVGTVEGRELLLKYGLLEKIPVEISKAPVVEGRPVVTAPGTEGAKA